LQIVVDQLRRASFVRALTFSPETLNPKAFCIPRLTPSRLAQACGLATFA
jgi:hypothetical protein